MEEKILKEYLDFAKALAVEAGEIMLKHFRAQTLTTTWKGDRTPVTIADQEINSLVIERVTSTYPDHGIIGEEESHEPEREFVWVVDPIDGTALYNLGIPNSTFCLALVVDGEAQVSVVFDPYTKRLFSAAKGRGAYKNDTLCKTPLITEFEHVYAFIPTGSKEQTNLYEKLIIDLKRQHSKVLFIPSFSYLATLVIEGSASAALMAFGSPWDAAAISLIAQEAGCVATDLSGKPRKYNVWGNGILIANAGKSEYFIEGLKYANTRD